MISAPSSLIGSSARTPFKIRQNLLSSSKRVKLSGVEILCDVTYLPESPVRLHLLLAAGWCWPRLGIWSVMITAYHPQSNGMVECSHRQIKDALRPLGQAGRKAKFYKLPWRPGPTESPRTSLSLGTRQSLASGEADRPPKRQHLVQRLLEVSQCLICPLQDTI